MVPKDAQRNLVYGIMQREQRGLMNFQPNNFESKHMKGVECHIGVYGFENGIDPEFVGVVLVSNEKVPVKMTGTFSFHRIATSISIFQILILKQYLLLFACLLLMLSLVAIFLP